MAITFGKKLKNIYERLPELGRYSEYPAGWIDRMNLEEHTGFFGKAGFFIFQRLIFLVFFPFLAAVDMITSLVRAVGNFILGLFTADKEQDYFFANAKASASLFSKNFLGLLLSIVGIINPSWVSFFFVPKKQIAGVESGGALYHDNVEKVTPDNVEALQKIIRSASKNNQSVMAVGAGRSQGQQFIPKSKNGKNGILIDMSEFNTVEINPDAKTAIVGSGVRWADLQSAANNNKLALKVMQASNVFSVGGSIGTNIHGWDHRSGNLAHVIRSLTIVNAQGNIEKVERGSEIFSQILGGFGLFGIVVNAEIELTDNEQLVEKGVDVPIESYVNYFKNEVQSNDNIRMHLFRLSLDPSNLLGNGVAVNYTKLDQSTPVKSTDTFKEGENGTRWERMQTNVARRFGVIRKRYWEGEKSRLLHTQTLSTTNEIMRPPINAMFNDSVSESEWLQEFFVPGENLADFIKELGELLTKNKVPLLNSSVRFVKKDEYSKFGYAVDGDRFSVVLCFNQSLQQSQIIQTKKWVRAANDLVIKHGGTFYLPYQQFASQKQFEDAYGQERVRAFQQAKEAADPNGVFDSGLYEYYLKPKEARPNLFQELMRSDALKKKFAGFLENILQRVDTGPFYALLEDILKYNDTHEEIYSELLRRLPDVMPGGLSALPKILNSLAHIKEDLGAQAKALLPDVDTIDGLVEIGYPGRFVGGFQSNFQLTGPITAVYEAQSLSDFVQSGFPRPYKHFVKLDYNAPDLSSIPENSADVITCYVGLHHFPEYQLEQFLKNVRRILRPNGHFLLVDHDIDNTDTLLMANMAHSVFNAVTGVSVQEEMTELRSFKPMSYWQALLGKYGLGNAQTGPDVPMIREGDPSRNKMVGFVKGRELRALKESVEEIGESPCRGARMRMFEPSPSSDEVVQAKDNKPTLPRL